MPSTRTALDPGLEGRAGEPSRGRRRLNRSSVDVRSRLLEAALAEFAAHGFEGTSTRAIAERAGAHQPQINYHFDSKDELWRICLVQLLEELQASIEGHVAELDRQTEADTFAAIITGFVVYAARRPELNRIMSHEATVASSRLEWLVEHHLQWRHDELQRRWAHLVASGVAAPLPAETIFHVLIGAASTFYVHAPEARLLGIDTRGDDLVLDHARGVVAMLLPGHDS